MKNITDISLFSSFAKDRIVNQKNQVIRVQRGGPARYLTAAFSREAIRFTLPKRTDVSVDILLTNQGEFGRIQIKPKPIIIPWNTIRTPYVCISTILDEYTLADPRVYQGNIFIDIQGYVRNGTDFGKKQLWKPPIFYNFLCIKCTKQEAQFIPTSYIKKQKQRMLLITDGKNGSLLYWKNRKIIIRPTPIYNLVNTIGAGDTLFGYFISSLVRTKRPEIALNYATQKTSNFLQKLICTKV